jgi:acetylornithine deacetylase/succinyl-diaminopimelate desuccinylase-like protein
MAHKTDEYCYISKIEEATQAYMEIAMNWCGLEACHQKGLLARI